MISQQYFARESRLKPVWKTEYIYNQLSKVYLGDRLVKELYQRLEGLNILLERMGGFMINEEILTAAEAERDKALAAGINADNYQRTCDFCQMLQGFCQAYQLPDFEFAIIIAERFKTSYKKLRKAITMRQRNCFIYTPPQKIFGKAIN